MTLPRPIVAISQARVGSTRLPAKVLRPIAGRPLIWWHLVRLRQAHRLDRIVLATTSEPQSDRLAAIAGDLGIAAFHGSEIDVLGRFAGAAALAGAGTIVRVTSDCPLIDPALIDRLVELYESGQPDCLYAAIDVGAFPRGLDAEIFPRGLLDRAHERATTQHDREHVTPWIRRRAEPGARYLAPDHALEPQRWCVDTADDLALVARLIEGLGERALAAGWWDCLRLIEDHPDWHDLNRHVVQKLG